MSSQPQPYQLHRVFKFPTNDGTAQAVSFSQKDAATLISFYSTMVKLIIAQVWGLLVLLTVTFYMRKRHSRNRGALTVGIVNSQSSTTSVLMLITKYAHHMMDDWRYVLLWAILTAAAFAAGIVAPLLVSRALLLGSVAPVSVDAVWVPSKIRTADAQLAKAYGLEAPAFLRATSKIATDSDVITVTQRSLPAPDSRLAVDYGYQITAAQLGLQILTGFKIVVSGSCHTEYSWLVPAATPNDDDVYYIWNDRNDVSLRWNVTFNDGGPPFGVFWDIDKESYFTNKSWAVIPSSRGRYSYTLGTDPWYLTNLVSNNRFRHQVQGSRPALSCWETVILELNGRTLNLGDLSTLDPALDVSKEASSAASSFIGMVLQAWLLGSSLRRVGSALDRISLASSSVSFNGGFDAESSSILTDMQHLVSASYFATKDLFVESTLFPQNARSEFHNLARSDGDELLAHVGDFVIPSSDVSALSLLVLIIVPVVLIALLSTLQLVKKFSAPCHVVDALGGPILYSYLDQSTNGDNGTENNWKREDSVAYVSGNELARFNPTWKDKETGPEWTAAPEYATVFHGPDKV